jgi:hypothetical protein
LISSRKTESNINAKKSISDLRAEGAAIYAELFNPKFGQSAFALAA